MESTKTAAVMASAEITPLFETLGFSVYPTDEYSPEDLYETLKADPSKVGLVCISETVPVEEKLQEKLFGLDIPLMFFPEEDGNGSQALESLVERAIGMKPDFLKE